MNRPSSAGAWTSEVRRTRLACIPIGVSQAEDLRVLALNPALVCLKKCWLIPLSPNPHLALG